MNYLKQIRIEDFIATILFSFSMRMSSNFYQEFNTNVAISRHILALFALVVFAIVASIYKIRKTIIIDSIKSEVELPSLTLKEELIETLKNKKEILMVIRDYIPFIVILVSYYNIIKLSHSLNIINFYRVPSIIHSFAELINQTLNTHSTFKTLASISYKTHFVSVPILAMYMYLLKTQRMFRRLMLAISISLITSLVMAKSTTIGFNHISMPVCFTSIVLIYATKVSKPVTHLFLPVATLLLLMDIGININNLYTTIAGILNAITSVFIADTVIKLEYRFRRLFFG